MRRHKKLRSVAARRWQQLKPLEKRYVFLVLLLCFIATGLGIRGAYGALRYHGDQKPLPAEMSEIQEILAAPDSPAKQSKAYLKLIKRIGPEAAQEALLRSGLPFNGNSHLVNHTVGDYLYEKEGNKGLVYCKEYFLASCYHGFTLHIVAGEKGKIKENVKEVMSYCEERGRQIVVQCSHAIGHGALAYVGYGQLTDALTLCDEIQNSVNSMPAIDCYDGVFMENIFGVHGGEPAPDRWVNPSDLRYPCNDPRIDDRYLEACWRNQVTIMWPALSMNAKLVSEQCLDVENFLYRETCMHGVARAIQLDSRDDTDFIIRNCRSLHHDWQTYCLQIAANTAFAFGDRKSTFTICEVMDRIEDRTLCRDIGYSMIRDFSKGEAEQVQACKEFAGSFEADCMKKVEGPPRQAVTF